MKSKFTYILLLSFCGIQMFAQLSHLVVIDPSGLDGEEIKSIKAVIASSKEVVKGLEAEGEEFLVLICNDQSPILFGNDEDYQNQLDTISFLDPYIPTPLATVRSIITSLDKKKLAQNKFVIHYMSSLTNLCSHSSNHKESIIGAVLSILEDEVNTLSREQVKLYISSNDRKLNPVYFQELRKLFNITIYP
tara:strand:- start:7903 stop:8475 length:573 start_codon:yes stop_codon:yes gene_type:complete